MLNPSEVYVGRINKLYRNTGITVEAVNGVWVDRGGFLPNQPTYKPDEDGWWQGNERQILVASSWDLGHVATRLGVKLLGHEQETKGMVASHCPARALMVVDSSSSWSADADIMGPGSVLTVMADERNAKLQLRLTEAPGRTEREVWAGTVQQAVRNRGAQPPSSAAQFTDTIDNMHVWYGMVNGVRADDTHTMATCLFEGDVVQVRPPVTYS